MDSIGNHKNKSQISIANYKTQNLPCSYMAIEVAKTLGVDWQFRYNSRTNKTTITNTL